MHDDDTPPDPHTTEAKATLHDAVAPFVTSLAATAETQLRARATTADPLTLALARQCAREVGKLMRGEPQLPFLRSVRFNGDDVSPASFSAGLRALEAALGAFRRRYFGWHKTLQGPGWFIAGADGDIAAWRQFTRPMAAPPPGKQWPGPKPKSADEMRTEIIRRIEAYRDDAHEAKAELAALNARIKRGELIPNPSWVAADPSTTPGHPRESGDLRLPRVLGP